MSATAPEAGHKPKAKNPPAMALRRIGSVYGETITANAGLTWALDPDAPVRDATKAEQAVYASRATDPEFEYLYQHHGEALPRLLPDPEPSRVTGPLYREGALSARENPPQISRGPLSGYAVPPLGDAPTMPPGTLVLSPPRHGEAEFIAAATLQMPRSPEVEARIAETVPDMPLGDLDPDATASMTRLLDAWELDPDSDYDPGYDTGNRGGSGDR